MLPESSVTPYQFHVNSVSHDLCSPTFCHRRTSRRISELSYIQSTLVHLNAILWYRHGNKVGARRYQTVSHHDMLPLILMTPLVHCQCSTSRWVIVRATPLQRKVAQEHGSHLPICASGLCGPSFGDYQGDMYAFREKECWTLDAMGRLWNSGKMKRRKEGLNLDHYNFDKWMGDRCVVQLHVDGKSYSKCYAPQLTISTIVASSREDS